jgi:short-subunit dehydrogenase
MKKINMDNRNKYALITGATSGIGNELSKLFAEDGYNLILVARNSDLLQEHCDELKTRFDIEVTPIVKDLFHPAAAEEIYAATRQMGIHVDVLVNDAGQGEWGKFTEIPLQRSLDIIQLNISSLVSLTKFYADEMVNRGEGKILQLGSEAAKTPIPLLSVYAATKAFVVSFSEALNNELKDTGVTITVLLPGATDTDFFHKAHMEHTVTYVENDLQDPKDVAKDGYEGLMKGHERVISGAKTKMHVYMSNVMPDAVSAANMRKDMEPSKKSDGRTHTEHESSARERESIMQHTSSPSGDYNKDRERH